MKKVLEIGITGGIGSGKSIICKVFQALGVLVYNADDRAKWLMQHHEQLKKDIIINFGKQAYLPTGDLNRQYLAKQVFQNEEKRQQLNALVHPKVGEDYQDWVQENKNQAYLLNEAALMFEAGRYKFLDKVITVFAPKEIRLQRVLKRDPQRSQSQVEAIMQKQLSEEEKIQLADFVIYNDDKQAVLPQVLALDKRFRVIN